jgi:hypothetical protein
MERVSAPLAAADRAELAPLYEAWRAGDDQAARDAACEALLRAAARQVGQA